MPEYVSLVDVYLFIYLFMPQNSDVERLHLMVKIEYTHLPSLITCLDSVGLAQNDLTFPEIKFIFKGGWLAIIKVIQNNLVYTQRAIMKEEMGKKNSHRVVKLW